MTLTPEWNLIISLIALGLMIFGLVGIIIPLVPSVFLIWITILSYALVTELNVITIPLLGIFSALILLMILLDYLETIRGTKPVKINILAILGAIAIGGIVFWISQQIIAFALGVLLGAVFMQLIQGQESHYTFETKRHIIIGFVGATILKVVIGLTIIALFVQVVYL